MQKFNTLDRIMNATLSELAETEGIGEKLAVNIKQYFEQLQ
jgi:ERCC4-type nuclease